MGAFLQQVAADRLGLHQEFAHPFLDGIGDISEMRSNLGAVRKPARNVGIWRGSGIIADHHLAAIADAHSINGIEIVVDDRGDLVAHRLRDRGVAVIVGADQPVLEMSVGAENLDVMRCFGIGRIAGESVADDGSDDGAEERSEARQEYVQRGADRRERKGKRAADRTRELAADRAVLAFGGEELVAEEAAERSGDVELGGIERGAPVDAGRQHRKAVDLHLMQHAAEPAADRGVEHLRADAV